MIKVVKYIVVEKYTYVDGEMSNWGEYYIFKNKLPKWNNCKFDIIMETNDYFEAQDKLKEMRKY